MEESNLPLTQAELEECLGRLRHSVNEFREDPNHIKEADMALLVDPGGTGVGVGVGVGVEMRVRICSLLAGHNAVVCCDRSAQ